MEPPFLVEELWLWLILATLCRIFNRKWIDWQVEQAIYPIIYGYNERKLAWFQSKLGIVSKIFACNIVMEPPFKKSCICHCYSLCAHLFMFANLLIANMGKTHNSQWIDARQSYWNSKLNNASILYYTRYTVWRVTHNIHSTVRSSLHNLGKFNKAAIIVMYKMHACVQEDNPSLTKTPKRATL